MSSELYFSLEPETIGNLHTDGHFPHFRNGPLLICPPLQGEFQTSASRTPWPPRRPAAGTGCASPSCPSRLSEREAREDTSTRSSSCRPRLAAGPQPRRPLGPPGRSSSPSPSPGARSSPGTPCPGRCGAEGGINHQGST